MIGVSVGFLVMVGGAFLPPLGWVALIIGGIIVVVASYTLQNRKAEIKIEHIMEYIELRQQIRALNNRI